MKTQLQQAREGVTTDTMRSVAKSEGMPVEEIVAGVAAGRAVIPHNPRHVKTRAAVVGRAFRTKINANIGRSPESSDGSGEMRKMNVAIDAGADFLMDLSVGEDLVGIRQQLIDSCQVPFGTVPIYEVVNRIGGDRSRISFDLFLDVISAQAEQGVDFMTLHAGILKKHLPFAARRKAGIVSRGGAILADFMAGSGQDNPLYVNWDRVLDVCAEHDVTVSLGDGLRPGCLADAGDDAQFAELDVLGELVMRCRDRGVQVMVEGPGHVPFGEIQENMEREQSVCDDAPFYVLGPVVTDVAPGYDHITSCIGATAAAYHGASLLCYVTPAEHLGLPDVDEVREGVMAFRIAAHAADVAKGLPGARNWDDSMTEARMAFDWERQFELAMDGEKARARYIRGREDDHDGNDSDHCSMCGRDFCALLASKSMAEKLSAETGS